MCCNNSEPNRDFFGTSRHLGYNVYEMLDPNNLEEFA